MMSYEEIFGYQRYLDNLGMIKIAFDKGVPIHLVNNLNLYNHYGNYDGDFTENFLALVNSAFDTVEYYDDQEKAISYWLSLAGCSEKYEKHLRVVVILDTTLADMEAVKCGENEMTDGSAEIYPIDLGVIVFFDENYGDPFWTEILDVLLSHREKTLNKQQREAIPYEMAIGN
ncbi:MAG: hypothetical protein R3267_06550 [Paenisporosarcina sp.]|nr:hypothetical protein [Paenisporosarcina sp.]